MLFFSTVAYGSLSYTESEPCLHTLWCHLLLANVRVPLGGNKGSHSSNHASNTNTATGSNIAMTKLNCNALNRALEPLQQAQEKQARAMEMMQSQLNSLSQQLAHQTAPNNRELFMMGAFIALQLVLFWLFK